MVVSLIGAFASAIFFGVAAVMEAIAARSIAAADGLDPRLLVRLIGQWRFLVAILLDLLGFLAELAALRSLPLFLVQAAVASYLAVTAIVAGWIMRIRLGPREWLGIAAVCGGLALLGATAATEAPARVSLTFRLVLLVCTVATGLVAIPVARLREPAKSVGLGLLAGLGFGFVGLGARVLTSLRPDRLLADPATYVIAGGGALAYLLYVTALQRGSVTTTTAALVVTETIVPAAIGIALLGDRTRPGLVPLAAVGFAIAIGGAISLARFAEPGGDEPEPDLPDEMVDLERKVRNP
jgi:drug/metabolite transporter (DMT)-like permease